MLRTLKNQQLQMLNQQIHAEEEEEGEEKELQLQ